MKRYTTISKPIILSAITKLEDYIKCTYGKAGRGVLIDNGLYQSVVDDGFIALEEFELEDELENTVILFVKEATRNTNKKAGDATTTSILILCALIKEVFSEFSLEDDFYTIAKELSKALEVTIKQLKKASKKISSVKDLEQVALNAYSNPLLAKIISEVVYKTGVDGIVSIEDSDTTETTFEVVTGMSLDKGFISPQMIPDSGKIELNNTAIVLTDETIRDWNQILPIIKTIGEAGHASFLLIAESVTDSALNGMITNGLIAVKSPGFGDENIEILRDIATATGAEVLSKRIENPLSAFSMDDCGFAKRVVISSEETAIIKGNGGEEIISNRVKSLKLRMKTCTPIEKKRLEERIAKLLGGVAIIKVGALTGTQSIGMKMKIDDAIHATKLALKEGRVLGGGVSLMNIKSGSNLLDAALKYPRKILEENGKKHIDADVYDSTGVIIIALESAVSVAIDLITCGGIITNKIKKDD